MDCGHSKESNVSYDNLLNCLRFLKIARQVGSTCSISVFYNMYFLFYKTVVGFSILLYSVISIKEPLNVIIFDVCGVSMK